jgi:hypothetical protein
VLDNVPAGPDVLGSLSDYQHMQRKVAHGCWDASCSLCDTV